MKNAAIVFMFLAVAAAAFSPAPVDQNEIDLCEKTGGKVNITMYDPGRGRRAEAGMPQSSFMPKLMFKCYCPAELVWNESLGCVEVRSPSILDRIIAFIKSLFGGLL